MTERARNLPSVFDEWVRDLQHDPDLSEVEAAMLLDVMETAASRCRELMKSVPRGMTLGEARAAGLITDEQFDGLFTPKGRPN